MRKYEVLTILKPNLNEEETNKTFDDLQKVVASQGGKVTEIDKWGQRNLAYEMDKFNTGLYVLIKFEAEPEMLGKLDNFCKINGEILRYMISRAFEEDTEGKEENKET